MKSIFFSFLLVLQLSGIATAAEYKFNLVNKTGFEIIDLYFSPAAKNQWGDEVLTVDTIPNKESLEIHLQRKEKADAWDVKVNDEQGGSFKWPKVKLSEISTLVLIIKAGQPIAIYE